MANFTLRPMTVSERKYSYVQSPQIQGQTGNIGYLRGDFGSNGNWFYTTWFDTRSQWKSDEFKQDLDDVINALRSQNYGLLRDRATMYSVCRENKDSEMKGNYTTEFGFRADSEKYAFLLRCIPVQGDYNFYCFCYVRKWLDKHIEEANRDIRFIDSHYKELFRIPDGEHIIITDRYGKMKSYPCRYIDDYHLEVGSNLYHICEFAERMEQNGNTVIPLRSSLPEQCYVFVQTENCVGIVKKGESGFYRTDIQGGKPSETNALVNEMNEKLGLSKGQAEAMKAGSMFGWDTPAADPKSYDKNGIPVRPKQKDYER